MSLKKTYSKSKNVCKVTFSCPDKAASQVHVVGDFNQWDTAALPMKKGKTGFSATVELEADKDYQYRYLIDGERWANDDSADSYVAGPYHDCQNCVVSTRQQA